MWRKFSKPNTMIQHVLSNDEKKDTYFLFDTNFLPGAQVNNI